jgi:hypothetical protein
MASAIQDAARLDPETCRAVGRDRFSLERMIEGYLSVYRRLAGRARDPLEGAA